MLNSLKQGAVILVKHPFTVFGGYLTIIIVGALSLGILLPALLAGYYSCLLKLAIGENAGIRDIFKNTFRYFGHNWLTGFFYLLIFIASGALTQIPHVGFALAAIVSWVPFFFIPMAVDEPNIKTFSLLIFPKNILLVFEHLREVIVIGLGIYLCQLLLIKIPVSIFTSFYKEMTISRWVSCYAIIILLLLLIQSWRDAAAAVAYMNAEHPGKVSK